MPDIATSKKDRKTRTPGPAAATMTMVVSEADIARRAYEYYCARGGQGGDALDDWLRAERELTTVATPTPPKRQRKAKSVN